MEGKLVWWRLGEGELWSAGERMEACRRADYVRQVEVVAELWNRTSRSKDDQSVMVADLMAWWKVTRSEAKDLLRHAELFRREAILSSLLAPIGETGANGGES